MWPGRWTWPAPWPRNCAAGTAFPCGCATSTCTPGSACANSSRPWWPTRSCISPRVPWPPRISSRPGRRRRTAIWPGSRCSTPSSARPRPLGDGSRCATPCTMPGGIFTRISWSRPACPRATSSSTAIPPWDCMPSPTGAFSRTGRPWRPATALIRSGAGSLSRKTTAGLS